MDYALQVHQAKYIFPVPDGLKELSSDIIREVLRHQPEHINGFIADYLETMLIVRENARDAGVLVCETFRQGYFFDELFKTKNVTREMANTFATIIQAAWRGYVVRKKLGEWLKKKKKFEEEKERKRSLKIEELLAGLGITYDEATRAAGLIQVAYKDSKLGRLTSRKFGELWVGESVPFGQRVREGDRAMGRFDRWEKEDFGDFFEMDELGAIKYVWPRVGQLRKVLRDEVPKTAIIVEFFAMRDLQGQEQYSYLLKTQPGSETRGVPIGFLTPIPKSSLFDTSQEVEFVTPENIIKMGNYTYVFRDDCTKEDLEKFDELLKAQATTPFKAEIIGEFDYDPHWVLPRALIRIKKEFLLETDDEVRFSALPSGVVCEEETYTFRAESAQLTTKIIRQILRDKCLTLEEAMIEVSNMAPYKERETGRIFPVDNFVHPKFVQKIEILPESPTGADEAMEIGHYCYVFVPQESVHGKVSTKGTPIMQIPIVRFQGYHSEYKGSEALEDKVFIMGPKMTTPNGKPFTFESLFWDEFGEVAWYQLLYNLSMQEAMAEEEEHEVGGEIEEIPVEIEGEFGEKDYDKILHKEDTATARSDQTEITAKPEESDTGKVAAPPTAPPTEVSEAEGEAKMEIKPPEKEPEKEEEAKEEPKPETETQ